MIDVSEDRAAQMKGYLQRAKEQAENAIALLEKVQADDYTYNIEDFIDLADRVGSLILNSRWATEDSFRLSVPL